MQDRMHRAGFRYEVSHRVPVSDSIANESPLNTSCDRPDGRLYGTLMRTPGHDKALILGLMTGEGDLRSEEPLPETQCQDGNVHVVWNGVPSHRSLDSTSSCGIYKQNKIIQCATKVMCIGILYNKIGQIIKKKDEINE